MKEKDEWERLAETNIASEEIFDGIIMHVYRDTVKLPDGKEAFRELMRHIGAVCVIPVTEDNEVIVERQYRYPINKIITEIPAGKLNSKQEDRLLAAKRELLEETGITADNWLDMGELYCACAYSDEMINVYLATGLHFGERKLDEDEFLDVKKVPLKELVDQVMRGEIADSKTQIAILKTARHLGI